MRCQGGLGAGGGGQVDNASGVPAAASSARLHSACGEGDVRLRHRQTQTRGEALTCEAASGGESVPGSRGSCLLRLPKLMSSHVYPMLGCTKISKCCRH